MFCKPASEDLIPKMELFVCHVKTANMHHAPAIDIPPDCHFACRMLIYDMVLPVKQYLSVLPAQQLCNESYFFIDCEWVFLTNFCMKKAINVETISISTPIHQSLFE